MAKNNESVGIAAEVAIAKTFGINIDPLYAQRAEPGVVNLLLSDNSIKTIFDREGIPYPRKHVAQGQSAVDFLLTNDETLSVKTNQRKSGKVAPQKIGQASQTTFFEFLEDNHILPGFSIEGTLKEKNLTDNYENRALIFKEITLKNTDVLVNMYWKNLFECDYLIFFFNLETLQNPLENYRVFWRSGNCPKWIKGHFSFTRGISLWNESSTLKYEGVRIGEFQIHRHRDCFKFRFDLDGIMKLIDKGQI